MSGQQLTGRFFSHPYQVTVYKMAAKIPAVLSQQPCYCRCDQALGHNSLHSCFENPARRRRAAWSRLFHLHEGSRLQLPADPEGKISRSKSAPASKRASG